MALLLFEGLSVSHESQSQLLFLIIEQVGKPFSQTQLQTCLAPYKFDFKRCLVQSHDTDDQNLVSIFSILDDFRVLLVHDELMAGGTGHFAGLVPLEIGVDHCVGSVDHNLIGLPWLHCLFEVQSLVQVDLGLDYVLLNLVVDYMVEYVGSFQVEFEPATLTSVRRLYFDVATFVERTSVGVSKVFLAWIGNDSHVLLLAYHLIFDLRTHHEAQPLIFLGTEIHVIEDMYLTCCTIYYLDLHENGLVLNYFDQETEGYYLEGLMDRFCDYKGNVVEFMIFELYLRDVKFG